MMERPKVPRHKGKLLLLKALHKMTKLTQRQMPTGQRKL
jgi:hypothetical protein